jgi:hypothetical protein
MEPMGMAIVDHLSGGNLDSPTPALPTSLDKICLLNWRWLDQSGISAVAWAYYYFSVQFRENLYVAYRHNPSEMLQRLVEDECDTDNLSPWPGIAAKGEKLNHDEFMRRALDLSPVDPSIRWRVREAGEMYLAQVRAAADSTRSASIASYEDGGLKRVFTAILQCQCWDTPLLAAFRHFLERHIYFDSKADDSHSALVRHLPTDDGVDRLWSEFYGLLVAAEPRLVE